MLPTDGQGIKLLGTPLGHPDFVARHVRSVTEEHQVLLQRIPRVRDLQSAWLLLLHCASARADCNLRAVDPGSSVDFARAHDDDIWQCTCDILHVDPTQARSVKDVASLPLVLGGLGLRSAEQVRVPVLGELGRLHPDHPRSSPCGGRCVGPPVGGSSTHTMFACRSVSQWPLGRSPPSWTAVWNGARPETRQPEEYEPGSTRGWQHEAAFRVDQRFRDEDLFANLTDSGQALVRSQGGHGAGLALSTCPTCRITRIDPQLFRVILLRRLRLPLPLTVRSCRCGLPLDACGHHCAACARAGVLGGRGTLWTRAQPTQANLVSLLWPVQQRPAPTKASPI